MPLETSALHDIIFLVFLIIMYFVLTSMFLAIINESHIQAQKHYKKNKDKMQFVNYTMAFEILCSWALPLQERITRARAEEAEYRKQRLQCNPLLSIGFDTLIDFVWLYTLNLTNIFSILGCSMVVGHLVTLKIILN